MGSPITFSGFNSIDFSLILNSIMQQASQPLTALQTQQANLQSQISTFNTLTTRVSFVESAAHDLADVTQVASFAGTSSDASAVSISVGSSAQTGQHQVVVTELAHAQVTASTSTAPDATTTAVATGGTLTIGGVAVNLTGPTTLQQLADAINGTSGIGVSASVVRTGTTSYRLSLTSHDTGVAHAFTITNGLTGGSGVTFGDFDHDGVSGDSAQDNSVTATDAAILLDNIAATSSSNTFDGVLSGVTLTVSKKDPLATIDLTVSHDNDALKAKVNSFIVAYNSTVRFVQDQRAASGRGEVASIGRDPLLRQLHNSLRSVLVGAHGSGSVTRLAEMGIEFTQSGTLELNDALFDEAISTKGSDVRALLAGPAGAFPAVADILDEYSNAAGFISNAKDRLTNQVSAMDDQIARMQNRLAVQRQALQQEFAAADRAMSQLKSQSSSLSSFSSSLGTNL